MTNEALYESLTYLPDHETGFGELEEKQRAQEVMDVAHLMSNASGRPVRVHQGKNGVEIKAHDGPVLPGEILITPNRENGVEIKTHDGPAQGETLITPNTEVSVVPKQEQTARISSREYGVTFLVLLGQINGKLTPISCFVDSKEPMANAAK